MGGRVLWEGDVTDRVCDMYLIYDILDIDIYSGTYVDIPDGDMTCHSPNGEM